MKINLSEKLEIIKNIKNDCENNKNKNINYYIFISNFVKNIFYAEDEKLSLENICDNFMLNNIDRMLSEYYHKSTGIFKNIFIS